MPPTRSKTSRKQIDLLQSDRKRAPRNRNKLARDRPGEPIIFTDSKPSLRGANISLNKLCNDSPRTRAPVSTTPLAMDDKPRRSARQHSAGHAAADGDVSKGSKSPNASLTIHTNSKRIRREASATSLASKASKAKKAKVRPGISRNSSALSVHSRPSISRNSSIRSVKHLLIPTTDDVAITSGDEAYEDSVMDSSMPVRPTISINLDESMTERPQWAVRHRIYFDNELISTTTSMQRPGYHKFQDILLREQIETRLHTAHHGEGAHFATRHAILRFWLGDGSLSEKWMDKDMGGEKEHEFAMENMNDWTILYLSMGGEEATSESGSEADADMSVNHTDNETADEADMDDNDNDDTRNEEEVFPTMDIVAHYITDYHDARNIASAPGVSASDDEEDEDEDEGERDEQDEQMTNTNKNPIKTDPGRLPLERKDSVPIYHWVEERRRTLEHQLRTYFHCPSPSCFNKGGTCLAISPAQHLHVGVKDLTDWSQQIAHANRSIAASTLHLAAKLIDDQVRAQDERLADVGREREDEDDLGEVLRSYTALGGMRPAGPDEEPVEMEMLD